MHNIDNVRFTNALFFFNPITPPFRSRSVLETYPITELEEALVSQIIRLRKDKLRLGVHARYRFVDRSKAHGVCRAHPVAHHVELDVRVNVDPLTRAGKQRQTHFVLVGRVGPFGLVEAQLVQGLQASQIDPVLLFDRNVGAVFLFTRRLGIVNAMPKPNL